MTMRSFFDGHVLCQHPLSFVKLNIDNCFSAKMGNEGTGIALELATNSKLFRQLPSAIHVL
jgi:hypothetical protein